MRGTYHMVAFAGGVLVGGGAVLAAVCSLIGWKVARDGPPWGYR